MRTLHLLLVSLFVGVSLGCKTGKPYVEEPPAPTMTEGPAASILPVSSSWEGFYQVADKESHTLRFEVHDVGGSTVEGNMWNDAVPGATKVGPFSATLEGTDFDIVFRPEGRQGMETRFDGTLHTKVVAGSFVTTGPGIETETGTFQLIRAD